MSDDAEQASLDDVVEEYAEEKHNANNEVTKPTEWGNVPERWEQRKIDKVTELVTDGTHNPPKRSEDGIQLLSSQNIQNGKIDFEKEPSYVSPEDFEDMDRNLSIQEGDLLLTIVGSIGRSAIVEGRSDFAIQRSIALLRTDDSILTRFLRFVTDDYRFHKQADARSRMTAQGGLYLEALRKINVPLPPFPEQRKIASVLYNVDEAIRKTEEIIEQTKRVKDGLHRSIFSRGLDSTGSLRPKPSKDGGLYSDTSIGVLPNDWDIHRIADIVPDERPVTYGIVQPGEYTEDGVPLIRGQNYIDGWDPISEFFRVDPELHEEYSRCITLPRDVIMCIAGVNTGKVNIVPDWIEEANLTQTTARIAVDEDIAIPEYVRLALSSNAVQRQVTGWTRGSAQPGLNLERVEKFKVPIPPMDEQKEIVSKLGALSDGISKEGEIKDELLAIKRGLMQDLLTGEVRTADRDIEVLPEVEAHG
jgi:type I restriction enzyme S subunit